MSGLGTSTEAAELELREVHGPTSIGGGRRRFFELLYLISVTEFRKSYFGTVLGYAWSLLRPLMIFAVLLVVFTQIFRVCLGSSCSDPSDMSFTLVSKRSMRKWDPLSSLLM